MAARSPSASPRHDRRRNGSRRDSGSFLKLGEIRAATEKDFRFFINMADNHDDWLKKVEKNGLTMWQKEVPNSMIKMLKVAGSFSGVKAGTAFDVLMDDSYRKSWDDSMIEDLNICRLDDNNDIGYYSMKWPAPFKNRDLVNQRSWKCYSEDEFVIFNHSVFHPEQPPRKNFVRAFSHITGFVIRGSPSGCDLIYLTQSDPRGNIPKWLINFALNKIAPAVFKQLLIAAKKYEDWKKDNSPDHKPWINPHQSTLPLADLSLLTQGGTSSLDLKTTPTETEEEVATEASVEQAVENFVEHLEHQQAQAM